MELHDFQDDVVTNDSLDHVIDESKTTMDLEALRDVIMWTCLDVFIAVCVLVNILLLVTVFSSRKLRRGATAGLVITLTISNILNVVCNRVISEYQDLHETEPAGDIACKVGTYLDALFSTTSMFMLVAIACDRYMAVCRPLSLQKRTGSPLQQGAIRAAICWFVAALLSIPQIIIHRLKEDPEESHEDANAWNSTDTLSDAVNNTYGNDTTDDLPTMGPLYCSRDPPDWLKEYSRWEPAMYFLVGYAIPMTIIFTLYGITANTLVKSGTLERRNTRDRHQQDREHAARSLIGLALINLLIMLPMEILALILEYEMIEKDKLFEIAYISFYTYVISCMINTVMVYILSHKYRAQLFGILTCKVWFRRRSSRHDTANQSSSYRMNRIRVASTRSTGNDFDSHSTTVTSSSRY